MQFPNTFLSDAVATIPVVSANAETTREMWATVAAADHRRIIDAGDEVF
jgi:hypothetical protein